MIKKILIANRGEIALRIMRTCKEMGIDTVMIYSKADKDGLHVQLSQEAVCIGDFKLHDSYLNMSAIIQAALNTGCDAIHPGYGFLSENSKFAKLVEECGLIFIGPNYKIMEQMGNKVKARSLMKEIGIPLIEGVHLTNTNEISALDKAKKIGFPIMIKAAMGGGGKGMRIVYDSTNFINEYKNAMAEAKNNFGDDTLYLEKYIENPRHIEVQILGDHKGNIIHLYDRDCSFQRRNQKMIEEAPSPNLDFHIREKIVADAVRIARSIKYDSVGTIEFLFDGKNHYFMEMNTRLQVEHPITEMITGIDIVKEQIKISSQLPLTLKQSDIKINGWAIECRINGEDVKENFRPSSGKVTFLNLPGGQYVRIENSLYNNYSIPPYYDSMLLKVIVHGSSRLEAIKRMRRALEELLIEGIPNTIEFQYLVLHGKDFVKGEYHTGYFDLFLKDVIADGNFI